MSTEKQNIDWGNLGFNVYPTRSMWKGECGIDQSWSNGQLVPYGKMDLKLILDMSTTHTICGQNINAYMLLVIDYILNDTQV